MDGRDSAPAKRGHNGPPRQVIEKSFVTMDELRKAYRNKESFSISGTTIFVKLPFDPDMIAVMKSLTGSWNGKKKCWEIHVSKHPQLKQHIERIEELNKEDWFDRVNSEARDLARDIHIWVGHEDVGEYEEGSPTFYKDKTWIVTHIGRKRHIAGQGSMHAVYLKPIEDDPLLITSDPDFHGDD